MRTTCSTAWKVNSATTPHTRHGYTDDRHDERSRRRIAKSVNGVTGIPTGLTDLDRMTSGLQNGELVVAARPSVGKTAFALHLARQAAMAGHAVAVYSLEMQGNALATDG